MVLPLTMVSKVPTAYIVLPHCTSWRICCVVLSSAFRCGVLLAGTDDTTPDGGCSPPVPAWAAGTPTAITSVPAAAAAMRYFLMFAPCQPGLPQPGPASC